MRDRIECRHQCREPARREHQGIAAGDDDFPDGRRGPDVIECGRKLCLVEVFAAGPDHLAPEAEAAIHRAGMRRLQQDAVGIAVDDALDRREGIIADRVVALLRSAVEFPPVRQELAADRIGGIARVDQFGHGRRNRDRIARGYLLELAEPGRVD
jgi:hypothetical protein